MTRRDFLRSQLGVALGASVFPSIVPASVLGRGTSRAPGERIGVGCIGVGPQGRGVMAGFLGLQDVRVVAVCDVKRDQLELGRRQVLERYPGGDCAVYSDFRQVLARPDVDAVLIATPDHWHVLMAIEAVKAGKDVYLEKPMGLSLAEDRLLRAAVRKHDRIFQFGTQQRSSGEFWRACQLVRHGRVGRLKRIHVWAPASRPGGSTRPVPVPETIDYDRWLGPARYTPYTADKCTDTGAKTWWFNTDYALGFIAGWGVHPLDIALWGYPEMFQGPMKVEGRGIFPREGACDTAVAWEVNFALAQGVTMVYRGTPNGFDEPSALNDLKGWRDTYGEIQTHGTAFEGTDGWVAVWRGGLRTSPAGLAEEPFLSAQGALPKSSHHVRNFVESVRSRAATICPIEEAVRADTLCHLSDIATRLGRTLTFDPGQERFVGDDAADRKLELRPMRAPWTLS